MKSLPRLAQKPSVVEIDPIPRWDDVQEDLLNNLLKQTSISPSSTLSDLDLDILKRRGALTLPPPTLRKALLQSYVDNIHPITPIADILSIKLVQEYGTQDNDGLWDCQSIGFPLLQAIMFAGATHVAKIHLLSAGYTSREEACQTLFNRTKLLHEMGYSSVDDDCAVVRSLVLMSYWYRTAHGEVKDNRYWLSVALALAYKAHLHRDPALYTLSVNAQRYRKRIWWSLFIADQTLSLGSKLPCLIKINDFDVPPPTATDFIYGQGSEPRGKDYYLLDLGLIVTASRQRQIADSFIERCQLSVYTNLCLSATSISGIGDMTHRALKCQELAQNMQIWKDASKAVTQASPHVAPAEADESRMTRTHRALSDLMYYSCLFLVSEASVDQGLISRVFDNSNLLNIARLMANKSIIKVVDCLRSRHLPYIATQLFPDFTFFFQKNYNLDRDTVAAIRRGFRQLQLPWPPK